MPESSTPRSTQLITIGVLVIALAAVFLVGHAVGNDGNDGNDTSSAAASSSETFGVVTGGQASATGTPDQLTFTAAVHNTQPTNAQAMGLTNHDVRAITIAARNNGVDRKDIQTQSISIRPTYNPRYGSNRRLVGYAATQTVKFRVRDLSKAGKTIGAVVAAAGNAVDIGDARLSISNQDQLIARARTDAVKKSKAAAQALAKAAGQDVGRLEYVEEVQPQNIYGGVLDDKAFAVPTTNLSLRASSVAVNPGKQQLSVTVKVRWALAD